MQWNVRDFFESIFTITDTKTNFCYYYYGLILSLDKQVFLNNLSLIPFYFCCKGCEDVGHLSDCILCLLASNQHI